MPSSETKSRYNILAIILHWVMAFAFFGMLASGLSFDRWEGMSQSFKFQLYQWHKSLGVLLLLAFVLRLGVRLIDRPPAEPDELKPLDKKAAKFGHWILYAFMFAMPITGWLMVSSSPYGLPTIVFGWFEWPHIAFVSGSETVSRISKQAHEYIAYIFIVMICIHIAAVIKHYVADGVNLLPRMGLGKTKEKQ
jgi:cytochrome b561